jgi:acetyl-CoA acetyltransferase
MTGSRLVGTLMNELNRRGGRYGVVTMCVGGGTRGGGAVRARVIVAFQN